MGILAYCVVAIIAAGPDFSHLEEAHAHERASSSGGQVVRSVTMAYRAAPDHRPEKIEAMAKEMASGGQAAIPAISIVLRDPMVGLRHAAVLAVKKIDPPNLDEVLKLNLEDPDPGVMGEALRIVAKVQKPAVGARLVDAVDHEALAVRNAAREGLAKQLPEHVLAGLVAGLKNAKTTEAKRWWLMALGRVHGEQSLIELGLALDDAELRTAALRALGTYGTEAIEVLDGWATRQLERDPTSVEPAVAIIGSWDVPEARKALAALVASGSPGVGSRAAAALVRSGAEGRKMLTKLARSKHKEVRKLSLKALAGAEDMKLGKVIKKNLRAKDPELRMLAMALVREDPKGRLARKVARHYKKLVRKKKREEATREERHAALAALGRTRSKKAVKPLLKATAVENDTGPAIAALGAVGEPALRSLTKLLLRGGGELRPYLPKAFAAIGELAVAPLLGFLTDQRRYVREAARAGLMELADPASLPGLSALIDNKDTPERPRLLAILGRIGDQAAYRALREYGQEAADLTIRRAAVKALAQLDHDGVDPLLRGIAGRDSSELVSEIAVSSLVNRGDRASLDLMVRMLRFSKPNVQAYASVGVGYMADLKTLSKLVKAIKSNEDKPFDPPVLAALQRATYQTGMIRPSEFDRWLDANQEDEFAMPVIAQGVILDDGTTLSFVMDGDSEGMPLVVVPGGPDYGHAYLRDGVSKLGALSYVYVDLPGRGASPMPAGQPASIEHDASALAMLVQDLGYSKVAIYAHGWGATVAVLMAQRYPELVGKLVLDNPVPPTREWFEAAEKEAFAHLPAPWSSDIKRLPKGQGKRIARTRETMKERARLTGMVADTPVIARFVRELDGDPPLRRMILDGLGDFDFRASYQRLAVPTLVVLGAKGAWPAEVVRWWRKLRSGSGAVDEVELSGSGRFPCYEVPDAWKQGVAGFLERK